MDDTVGFNGLRVSATTKELGRVRIAMVGLDDTAAEAVLNETLIRFCDDQRDGRLRALLDSSILDVVPRLRFHSGKPTCGRDLGKERVPGFAKVLENHLVLLSEYSTAMRMLDKWLQKQEPPVDVLILFGSGSLRVQYAGGNGSKSFRFFWKSIESNRIRFQISY